MKNKLTTAIIFTVVTLVLAGCAMFADPKATSNSAQGAATQSQLFGYFVMEGSTTGCYGNPDDPLLKDKTYNTLYSLIMEDETTMLVCVTLPQAQSETSTTALANKTFTLYGSMSPNDPGQIQDLGALPLPLAGNSTAFYILGTKTPCPDGSGANLVGRTDMTDYLPLKYIQAYDGCGTCIGTTMSPAEAARQISQGFKTGTTPK